MLADFVTWATSRDHDAIVTAAMLQATVVQYVKRLAWPKIQAAVECIYSCQGQKQYVAGFL